MLRALIFILLTISIPDSQNAVRIKKKDKKKIVWVCMGPTAYAYHRDRKCEGLGMCGGEIRQVTLADAKKMGRGKKCRICY